MLHAKSAVADCRWARVGSTNLNVSSWMGNWELDVAVEDEGFAREMERAYELDLANSTEVTLAPRRLPARSRTATRHREGSAVAAAGAIRVGTTVGAALGGYRVLGSAEAKLLFAAGAALIVSATLAVLFPWVFLIPAVIAAAWIGITLIVDAIKLRRGHQLPVSGSDPPEQGSPGARNGPPGD